MTDFQIDSNAVGLSRVIVDGRDVTGDVHAVAVQTQAGQPTILTLHMHDAGTVAGVAGVVEVVTGGNPAGAVRALDPDTVYRRAMTMQRSLGGNVTVAILTAAAELLDEADQ